MATDGDVNPDTNFNPSLAPSPGCDIPVAEVIEQRAGDMVRRVDSRRIECVCRDCSARFAHTAPAASHARAHRHTVAVSYATLFEYVPAELLDGGR